MELRDVTLLDYGAGNVQSVAWTFCFFFGGSGDKLFDEEECSDNEIAVWYGYWKSCSKMYVVHICICILNLTDYTYALDS